MDMRVGILTGGGDAPGLNAVIYGALLRARENQNAEVIGIKKGWKVFDLPTRELTKDVIGRYTEILDVAKLDDLQVKGGTILYTTRTNPFKDVFKQTKDIDREKVKRAVAKDLTGKMKVLGLDALIAVGGDDTLGVSAAMHKHGKANVVGCPKTIDNDLQGTNFTFGFFSGAQLASNNLEALNSTAHSHQRIFVVEVMGRDAGWLTLYAGLSAGSDIILIPETPFDFETDVIDVLKKRVEAGHVHHIIACAEGCYPTMESLRNHFKTITHAQIEAILDSEPDEFGHPNLGKLKMSTIIEEELKKRDDLKKSFIQHDVEYDVRSVMLGHTMRAGQPNVFDRVIGLRFGWHAMSYVLEGNYGKMVSLQGSEIVPADLVDGAKKKFIDPGSDLVAIRDAMVKVQVKRK